MNFRKVSKKVTRRSSYQEITNLSWEDDHIYDNSATTFRPNGKRMFDLPGKKEIGSIQVIWLWFRVPVPENPH